MKSHRVIEAAQHGVPPVGEDETFAGDQLANDVRH